METEGVGATVGGYHLEMYGKDGGADADEYGKMKRWGVGGNTHLRLNPPRAVQQHQTNS